MALVIFTPQIDVGISGWVFDVTKVETMMSKATVTSYGVETGSDISDHVRVEPKAFSLSGLISATPVDENQQYPARLQDLVNDLLELQRKEQLHQLVCVFGVIDNLVITDLTVTYDVTSNGDAMMIDMALQEVRFAIAETVRIVEVKVTEKSSNLGGEIGEDLVVGPDGVVRLEGWDGGLQRGFDGLNPDQRRLKAARAEKVTAFRKRIDEKIVNNDKIDDRTKKHQIIEMQNDRNLIDNGVFDDSVTGEKYEPMGLKFK